MRPQRASTQGRGGEGQWRWRRLGAESDAEAALQAALERPSPYMGAISRAGLGLGPRHETTGEPMPDVSSRRAAPGEERGVTHLLASARGGGEVLEHALARLSLPRTALARDEHLVVGSHSVVSSQWSVVSNQ